MLGKHTRLDGHLLLLSLLLLCSHLFINHPWCVFVLPGSKEPFLFRCFAYIQHICRNICVLGWEVLGFVVTAFPHLSCAGITPSRGPPLCLTLKRTRTKVEHVSAETHYMGTHRHTIGQRHVYTLWHLSSCCALRTCSNILHPSPCFSLSISLSLSPPPSLPQAIFCRLFMLLMSHGGRAISNILTSLHLLSSPPSLYPLLSFVLLVSSVDIQGHSHPVGCLRRLILYTGSSIEERGPCYYYI